MAQKLVMKWTKRKQPGERRAKQTQLTVHSVGEVLRAVENLLHHTGAHEVTKISIERVGG